MKKGVTLIELLLVIGIITIMLAATAPIGLSFYYRFQYISGYQQVLSSLRSAQASALDSDHASSHGVVFNQASLTQFEGTSFTNRNQRYDININLEGVTLATDFGSEIVFEQTTGLPTHTGQVSISSKSGTAIVKINEEGLIE
jgi:prepilin-type N-terminal cleavage/methylation domain-containing protein